MIVFCRDPYFHFGKTVIFSKDTSFMIKGGDQGILKRKNY